MVHDFWIGGLRVWLLLRERHVLSVLRKKIAVNAAGRRGEGGDVNMDSIWWNGFWIGWIFGVVASFAFLGGCAIISYRKEKSIR